VVGGGKFANGAQTGAFRYLFNDSAEHILTVTLTLPIGGGAVALVRGAGYTLKVWNYKKVGGIGVNLFKNGKRKFGVDFHKINYKGVEKARLHYHRGNSKRQRNKHRPYEGCW
jgi:hypothetical protein